MNIQFKEYLWLFIYQHGSSHKFSPALQDERDGLNRCPDGDDAADRAHPLVVPHLALYWN